MDNSLCLMDYETPLAPSHSSIFLQRLYSRYQHRLAPSSPLILSHLPSHYLIPPQCKHYQHPPYPSFSMRYPRISIDRQLEYWRGAGGEKQAKCMDKIVEEMIRGDKGGMIKRKRNRAVVRGRGSGAVSWVYAVGEQIREVVVEGNGEAIVFKQKEIFSKSVNRKIYELGACKEDIWARTNFQIVLFNEQGAIKRTVNFDEQVINCVFNPFNKAQFVASTYSPSTHTSTMSLHTSIPAPHPLLTCQSMLSSIQFISPSSLLLSTPSSLSIYDLRSPTPTSFSQTPTLQSCWIRTPYGNTPQFAVSTPTHLQIWDIRDSAEPVVSVRHMSEECPPDILQIYGGGGNWGTGVGEMLKRGGNGRMERPILLAHGSDRQTNCMFMTIGETNYAVSKDKFLTSLLDSNSAKRSKAQLPTLLFDSGKTYDILKPSSLSAFQLSQNKIGFFQSDNLGGVSLQSFTIQKQADRYLYIPLHQKSEQLITGQNLQNPNFSCALNMQTQRYLQNRIVKVESAKQQDMYVKTQEELQLYQRDPVEKRKTAIANMRKFYNRVFELSQKIEVEDSEEESSEEYSIVEDQNLPPNMEDNPPSRQLAQNGIIKPSLISYLQSVL